LQKVDDDNERQKKQEIAGYDIENSRNWALEGGNVIEFADS
jgi:hypothetical protein